MISKRHLCFLFVCSLSPSLAVADEVEEEREEEVVQELDIDRGPKTLAERIPSVTRRLFRKAGRVEMDPMVGISLNDPFYRHVVLSGAVNYHVFEWLWVGASGDFFAPLENEVPVSGAVQVKQPDYNKPSYAGRLEVGFSPIYGKLSMLAEKVFHFDLYVSGGVGMVGSSKGSTLMAGTAAIGQHFFFNEWFGVRVEFRDQIFRVVRFAGLNKELQHLFSLTVGACFYVPTTFERESL